MLHGVNLLSAFLFLECFFSLHLAWKRGLKEKYVSTSFLAYANFGWIWSVDRSMRCILKHVNNFSHRSQVKQWHSVVAFSSKWSWKICFHPKKINTQDTQHSCLRDTSVCVCPNVSICWIRFCFSPAYIHGTHPLHMSYEEKCTNTHRFPIWLSWLTREVRSQVQAIE